MNKTIFVSIAVLVVLIAGVAGFAALKSAAPAALGFGQSNGNPIFQNGLRTGLSTLYQVLDGVGGVAAQALTAVTGSFSTSVTIGSSGTAISTYKCASDNASFNPANMSSSSPATTTVAIAGPVTGDRIVGTFATTTNADQWYIAPGNIVTTGTTASATIAFVPIPGTAAWNTGLNLATGTLKVCYWH